MEDYEDAARLKVALAAAATNDTVGRVMSRLNVCNFISNSVFLRIRSAILLLSANNFFSFFWGCFREQ